MPVSQLIFIKCSELKKKENGDFSHIKQIINVTYSFENLKTIIFKALNVLSMSKFDFMSSLIHMAGFCLTNVNFLVSKWFATYHANYISCNRYT